MAGPGEVGGAGRDACGFGTHSLGIPDGQARGGSLRLERQNRFTFGYECHNLPELQFPQAVKHDSRPGSPVRRSALS